MRFAAPALLVLLAGCAVGPRYVRPADPERRAWTARAAGTSVADDEVALARWWSTFGDPELTTLVERALASNLDLRQARARVREARARRGGKVAEQWPSVSASASATRSRSTQSSVGGATTSDLFEASLDASWELDLFGGKRRAVEAAVATEQASVEDERDVRVSLAAEVGLTYLALRTSESRLAVARQSLDSLQQTADLTRWRAEAGLATQLDAEQARANLEQQRAAIPPLETDVAKDRTALAVLCGVAPGALDPDLQSARGVPTVPREVALGVPAETLRRRPDVRRAEMKLVAQTAQVGVAQADRYPTLTLSGSIGLESLAAGTLFGAGALATSVGASLVAPVFDAGGRAQAVVVQDAIREQYELAYRAAVLAAIKEVEDALVAFDREQARRSALEAATSAARDAEALARRQYEAGLIGFTSVLDAQRTLLGLQDALAASQGEVGADVIRLFKALGGGWSSSAATENP